MTHKKFLQKRIQEQSFYLCQLNAEFKKTPNILTDEKHRRKIEVYVSASGVMDNLCKQLHDEILKPLADMA